MPEKNYKSFTGLKEFYYGDLNETEDGIVGTAPERIKFLTDISVETPSEISRAYGDNQVAELAISNGPTTLTTSFVKIPLEDRAKLLGLRQIGTGYARTANADRPYIACAFSRTTENGATQWLGFAKGLFMSGSITGNTKTDGAVTFGSDQVNAEFMPRAVVGLEDDEEGSMFIFEDAKGETTGRDFLFELIFGVSHPDATPEGV